MALCNHFALGFIFTDHPKVISIFRERLVNIYRARVTRLITPVPKDPGELVPTLIPDLLNPSKTTNTLGQPWWIDLSRQSGEAWSKARVSFLIRLNEQREPLRRTLKSPLVLLLPKGEFSRIKSLVPDLWAIREFTVETKNWIAPDIRSKISAPEKPFPGKRKPVPFDESVIQEWKRLRNKKK